MGDATRHFSYREFDCKCPNDCGYVGHKMDSEFLAKLERIRVLVDFPMIVTSGARCPSWNNKVGGSPKSRHKKFDAADISCIDSVKRRMLIFAAIEEGLSVGVNSKFIHLDNRPGEPIVFTY